MKKPPFAYHQGYIINPPQESDVHKKLIELNFLHTQTWYTLFARHIYRKGEHYHYYYSDHGQLSVMYFESIEKAEEIYYKLPNRSDFKVYENTIEFICTLTNIEIINKLM